MVGESKTRILTSVVVSAGLRFNRSTVGGRLVVPERAENAAGRESE